MGRSKLPIADCVPRTAIPVRSVRLFVNVRVGRPLDFNVALLDLVVEVLGGRGRAGGLRFACSHTVRTITIDDGFGLFFFLFLGGDRPRPTNYLLRRQP